MEFLLITILDNTPGQIHNFEAKKSPIIEAGKSSWTSKPPFFSLQSVDPEAADPWSYWSRPLRNGRK